MKVCIVGASGKLGRYGTPEYNRMTATQKEAWDAHFGPRNQEFLADYKSGRLSHKDVVRWKYRRYMRNEMKSVNAEPDYQRTRAELFAELTRLRRQFDAPPLQ